VRLGGFLLRRLLASVPVALGVATLVFFLVEWAPGSPVDRILGDRPVPPHVRLRIERAYGVDRSAISRYADWLEGLLLRADLGWSVSRSQPVSRLLAEAWPATVLLAGSALVVHFLAAVFLGAVSARYRGRWPDRLLSWVSSFLYAMPGFWLGLMAILLLSLHAGIFPPGSVRSVGAEVWPWPARAVDVAWHTVLPAAVLGLGSAAATSRFVRASLLETLGERFVQSARARGAGTSRLLFVHALRNGLLPVLQLAGLSLPGLVSGSLVVEVVFGWPGMGRLTYEAILAEDLPVVASATLLASILVLLGSLLADLASAIADPRVRIRTQPAFS
jgi:peptide/nickel transport system permease protein